MKYIQLTNEEKKIKADLKGGRYKPVKNLTKRKAELKELAAMTLDKNKSVNVRLPESDILALKSKAAANGLPYQTLISTVIHQYVTGKVEVSL